MTWVIIATLVVVLIVAGIRLSLWSARRIEAEEHFWRRLRSSSPHAPGDWES